MSQINVVASGAGPNVFCLHGIGSSSAAFGPQMASLASEMRVLAWDAPGYAASADPELDLDLSGFADAAAATIRAHVDGPVHLLGVSWGGVIALRLAVRHPELVRSLIIVDSSRGSGRTPEQAAAMRDRVEELEAIGSTQFADRRAPRLLSGAASAGLVETVRSTMASAVRLPGYALAAASMATTDLSPELPSILAPTLVLCGAEDTVTGHAESQAIAGAIPHAVYVQLQGAGHLANQEAPDAFNAWVASYISIIEGLEA
jgi:3-oxoadipate enol-lactonase